MIQYTDVFNQDTMNIFTDASIYYHGKETIGLPGYIVVIGNRIIDSRVEVLRQSTNSQSELYAIKMAVDYAVRNRYVYNPKVINVFSDSSVSIYSLREWIFKWLAKSRNDTFYNSSNVEVYHRNIIMSIINTIMENNMPINLYHNRGHQNPRNPKQMNNFIKRFREMNFLNDDISRELATSIMMYNNSIDHMTRKYINMVDISSVPVLAIPDYYAYNFDTTTYRKLLNIKE